MSLFKREVVKPFRADLEAWRLAGWDWKPKHGSLGAHMLVHQVGVRATLIHRLAHWAKVRQLPLVPSLLKQLNTALHGIELSPSVPIGPGLYLPHTVGTVIHAVRIGSNVTIQGGVTIGLRTVREFPVIEDNVFLGAGCRVLGGIRIGRGATIGANAVVLTDVEPGATMVGVPARAVGRPAGDGVDAAAASVES